VNFCLIILSTFKNVDFMTVKCPRCGGDCEVDLEVGQTVELHCLTCALGFAVEADEGPTPLPTGTNLRAAARLGRLKAAQPAVAAYIAVLFGLAGITWLALVNWNALQVLESGSVAQRETPRRLAVEIGKWNFDNRGCLTGTVANATSATLHGIFITFDICAEDGTTVIGQAIDSLGELDPRATWRFSAPVWKHERVNARIRSIRSTEGVIWDRSQ
jgi:hypothetical protein